MHATVLSVTMVMLTGQLLYGLPLQSRIVRDTSKQQDKCTCKAGFYLTGGCKCAPCRTGFFTSMKNRESECIRCFQSCTHDFNMEKIKNCTTTSDVECRCQKGYSCASVDEVTGHCTSCDPINSPGPSYTSTEVTSLTTVPTGRSDSSTGQMDYLVWILAGFLSAMSSIIIFMLFLRFCSKKEKECFKQIVRQCSMGADVDSETAPPSQPDEQPHAQEIMSHISTSTNHNTELFHQPVSQEQAVPPAGNLGPLHIYGPQTVFVSLLNHFGGEQKAHEQEESLNNSNESYPKSPPVHLSEEERSAENDFIFFPSQEQGKECHISKEEVL